MGTALGALLTSVILAIFASNIATRLMLISERTGALGASLASFGFVMLGAAIVFRAIGLILAWYFSDILVLALSAAILLIAGFVGEALGAATIAIGVLYATGYARLAGVWMITAIFASLAATIYAALKGTFTYFVAINTVVEAPSFLAAASPFHESWRRGNQVDQSAFLGFMVGAVAPVAASVAAVYGVAPAILVSNLILLLSMVYIASWAREATRASQ
ncbi:hypothetical protein [Pyrolobus fumarii]|uniref:hypothetical protein n=1 Tax=Pyrolobus fumarii TaxID=54252 RepID=UPI0014329C5D|nr:hypothetical protein [Pyrolobus fumarii]